VGHDWVIFNWIGQGTTKRCQRCGLRIGFKSVDADGTVHYHGET
jgi:DNA-directed RNA polymerase subunit RPC12/RpoP